MHRVMSLEEWEDHFSQLSLKKANQAMADRMIEQRGRNRREKMGKMVEDEVRNALKMVGVTISKAQDAWIGHRNRVVEEEERRTTMGETTDNGTHIKDRVGGPVEVYTELPHYGLTDKCTEVLETLEATAKVLSELTGAPAVPVVDNVKPAPGSLNLLEARIGELSKMAKRLWELATAVKERV